MKRGFKLNLETCRQYLHSARADVSVLSKPIDMKKKQVS